MDERLDNLREGKHMDGQDGAWDDVPKTGPGSSREEPMAVTPEDEDIPYGSWCRCGYCGCIGRSTLAFDFYMKEPGSPLKCEICAQASAQASVRKDAR